MSQIIQTLKKTVPLSEDDCNNLLNITTASQLSKGDYWIERGEKNNHVAFLEEGFLRKFDMKDGNEITDFFYITGFKLLNNIKASYKYC